MREDGFRRTMNMLAMFSKLDWMTPQIRQEYLDAWSQPGAIEAMLRWYSGSPIVVPRVYEIVTDVPLLSIPPEKVAVKVPHLVVWGQADEALRASCLADLHHFAPDLAIKRVPDSGHWILHERPKEVAAAIRAFVGDAG